MLSLKGHGWEKGSDTVEALPEGLLLFILGGLDSVHLRAPYEVGGRLTEISFGLIFLGL